MLGCQCIPETWTAPLIQLHLTCCWPHLPYDNFSRNLHFVPYHLPPKFLPVLFMLFFPPLVAGCVFPLCLLSSSSRAVCVECWWHIVAGLVNHTYSQELSKLVGSKLWANSEYSYCPPKSTQARGVVVIHELWAQPFCLLWFRLEVWKVLHHWYIIAYMHGVSFNTRSWLQKYCDLSLNLMIFAYKYRLWLCV